MRAEQSIPSQSIKSSSSKRHFQSDLWGVPPIDTIGSSSRRKLSRDWSSFDCRAFVSDSPWMQSPNWASCNVGPVILIVCMRQPKLDYPMERNKNPWGILYLREITLKSRGKEVKFDGTRLTVYKFGIKIVSALVHPPLPPPPPPPKTTIPKKAPTTTLLHHELQIRLS
jgi:hypothetical protein